MPAPPIAIALNAVIFAVRDEAPLVLTIGARPGEDDIHNLPYGPFDPIRHRTFEIGLREWVGQQTHLDLGFVEQLYTFGDKGRESPAAVFLEPENIDARVVSVGYLALAQEPAEIDAPGAAWRDWRRYFPWEDWRDGPPAQVGDEIAPHLERWAANADNEALQTERLARASTCFALYGETWNEEKVLDRYELLYEAGLVHEAHRRSNGETTGELPLLGEPMASDHRRILATAIGRLRGKLKYRAVVFQLMPEEFTLFELQRTVEAISGFQLHKQNFRRAVERGGFVEATGALSTETGGRPAARFRFRREAVFEFAAAGLPIPRPKLTVDDLAQSCGRG